MKWNWWTTSFQEQNFGKYSANKVKKKHKYKQNIDEHLSSRETWTGAKLPLKNL